MVMERLVPNSSDRRVLCIYVVTVLNNALERSLQERTRLSFTMLSTLESRFDIRTQSLLLARGRPSRLR